MPIVKTKAGVKHFPYTKKGEAKAKKVAKETGGKMMMKPKMKHATGKSKTYNRYS